MPVSKIKPPTLQMMPFSEKNPLRGSENAMPVSKITPPGIIWNSAPFHLLTTTFIYFQADQASKVPFATSPTRAG
eukprot:11696301-Karenia_brevis.AAC.1